MLRPPKRYTNLNEGSYSWKARKISPIGVSSVVEVYRTNMSSQYPYGNEYKELTINYKTDCQHNRCVRNDY